MTKQTIVTNFEKRETTSQGFFNNYFESEIDISSNINDAIFSSFEKITDNKQSAVALANAVIQTSRSRQMEPMEVLQEFLTMDKDQLNAYLCMFLNLNRVNTSLLGIGNQTIKNKYIQRSILP